MSFGIAFVLGCQGTRAPVQPPAEANAVARKVLPGHDITMADALNVADCVAVGEVTRAPLPMGGHPGKAAAGFTFPLRVGFTARGPEIPKVTTCRERNMTKWEAEELRRRAVIVVGNLGEDGELAIAKVVDATRENAATVSGFGQSLFAALERSDDHWEWVRLASLARECDLAPPSDRPSATVRFLLADATHPDMKGIDVLTSRIAAMGDAAVPTLLAALRQTDSSRPTYRSVGWGTVANIPHFSMVALGKLKPLRAVPTLIDFIDEYEPQCRAFASDGEEFNAVVHTLRQITGQRIGKDPDEWRRWYERAMMDEAPLPGGR